MEMFWFFQHRFRRAYDSAYDSDFRNSLCRKLSYYSDYDFDSDSVAVKTSLKWSTELFHNSCKIAYLVKSALSQKSQVWCFKGVRGKFVHWFFSENFTIEG